VKRGGELITNHLKDIPVMTLNRLIQNFMMPREQSGHSIRVLLCKFGAAFDVSE
jgi:hypothetical protein